VASRPEFLLESVGITISGKTRLSRGHQVGMSTKRVAGCETHGEGVPSEVVRWRRRQLISAGFDDAMSVRLAASPDVDLHGLLNLVDRGCPPDLAVRILEPLTDSERWPGG
jgi:hypothetical protein